MWRIVARTACSLSWLLLTAFFPPAVFRFKAMIVKIDEDLAHLTAKKEESKARIEKGVVRS